MNCVSKRARVVGVSSTGEVLMHVFITERQAGCLPLGHMWRFSVRQRKCVLCDYKWNGIIIL